MGHGFGFGDGDCVDWHQQHVCSLYFLLSIPLLSSLRDVRSCGGRHGLGSRLCLLGLFVFRFLVFGLIKKLLTRTRKASPAGLPGHILAL